MINQLESDYDCSNAGDDLHQLKQKLEQLITNNNGERSTEATENLNRLKNQIHFIQNKCDIH